MNDQTAYSLQTMTCRRCAQQNPVWASFCSICAESCQSSALPLQAPQPVSALKAKTPQVGVTHSFDMPVEPARAIWALQRAVHAEHGEIIRHGTSGGFFIRQSKLLTLTRKVRFGGTFSVAPDGEGRSRVTLSMVCSQGSLNQLMILYLVCGIVLLPLSVFVLGAALWTYYDHTHRAASVLTAQLIEHTKAMGDIKPDER
jgi:ribosomal protein L40E